MTNALESLKKIDKKYLIIVFIVLLIVVSLAINTSLNKTSLKTNSSAAVLESNYPPDTNSIVAINTPSFSKPGYLTPYKDPTFGTTITRISDQTAFNDTYRGIRHAYSKIQPWNSDESLIMLSYEYEVKILDGKTYQYLRKMDLGETEVVWSNTNPLLGYGRGVTSNYTPTNQFININMSTGARTVLHTFSDFDSISIGQEEGNLSKDDQYVALIAKKGTAFSVVVYNIQTDTVVSTTALTKTPDWFSMSQSGNYVVACWNDIGSSRSQGIEVFDKNLTFLRQLDQDCSHGDLGFDTLNNEVMVYLPNSTYNPGASLIAKRLDTGAAKILAGRSPSFAAGHVSCRNISRPGWCYISSAEQYTGTLGYDEVFAVKIDPTATSYTYERFGHEHHSPTDQDYMAMPMGVPNHDGTRVMFATDWLGGSTAPVNDYVSQYINTSTSTTTPITTSVPTATLAPISVTTSTPIPTISPTPQQISDVTSPTVSITSPINGSSISRGQKTTFNATATDDVKVTKVEFIVSGSVKCTVMLSPYNCTWSVPSKPGVTYTIEAKAYDAAGNTASSIIKAISK